MKSNLITLFKVIGLLLTLLIVGIATFLTFGVYHPKELETVDIQTIEGAQPSREGAQTNDSLKVLSYNVQYFAGKDYVFYYDMEDFAGPDIRPSTASITQTLDSIAALILEQDADVVLLQEVDEGASRTDHEDQTLQLIERLNGNYPYFAETFYWKSAYVPHPKIKGSVGMKLTTLSKHPITQAVRHQLPRIKENFITAAFNFRRAILETHIQWNANQEIAVLNTHLDAFANSSDTMLKQVSKVDAVLQALQSQNIPWIIGGDFNLLPPDPESRFSTTVKAQYAAQTELLDFYKTHSAIPAHEDFNGEETNDWFTHFPNHPTAKAPDRIIDYIFYAPEFKRTKPTGVLHGKTLEYSDHLPLIGTFKFSSK